MVGSELVGFVGESGGGVYSGCLVNRQRSWWVLKGLVGDGWVCWVGLFV